MRKEALADGALDAASVLVDVLFAMVVAFAVLFAVGLGRRRSRSARARPERQTRPDEPRREAVAVPSWRPRPEPDEPPAARPTGTYGVRRVGQRFPEDPGLLL